MDCSRKTAYFALKRIWENDAYSQMALDLEIKKYKPENPAFVRELVLGTLTWQRRLDYYLRQLVKKGYRKLPLSVLILLRTGAYEILMMESIPDYAAVNESVQLADHFAHRHVSFVNGVLRNLSRKKEILRSPEIESDSVIRLCESYSYEEETVRHWIQEYGETRTESVLASLNKRRPLYITVNTLKVSPKRFQEEMEHGSFAAEPSEFSPFSFRVK
ncbi:MAG: transcription antitermination factor NusB, partial [Eubacteriales bacterium]|nr:transcription antitermination factor NusB [Eubacteriales bacterium]